MMLIARPTHKAVARSDDFMFVVIEASQREDTRLFVVADNCAAETGRFDGLQPRQFARRYANGASNGKQRPTSKGDNSEACA